MDTDPSGYYTYRQVKSNNPKKGRAGLLSLILRSAFLQCMDSLSCSTNRDLSFHILEVVQVTNWAHFPRTHMFSC